MVGTGCSGSEFDCPLLLIGFLIGFSSERGEIRVRMLAVCLLQQVVDKP
jgi:hypothetical protein